MYSAVIFDLDGTLLNTIDDLAASANHALAGLGLPLHTTAEIMGFVGNGIPKLIRRMVPAGTSEEIIRQAAALFDAHYSIHKNDSTAPYPGIPELLAALARHGVRTAVLSNKKHGMTVPIIAHYFPQSFTAVQGLEDGMAAKPDPAGVQRILERLQLDKEDVLYVGDSDTDMMTAVNAGLTACGVTWGFRSREVLVRGGAQILCDTAEELQALILDGPKERTSNQEVML